jgi:hypothetical protein
VLGTAGLLTTAIYLAGVLGPFSLLAHGTTLTDVNKLTAGDPLARAAVIAAFIVLFGLYGLALCGARRGGRPATALALAGTAGFSVTLIFLYPITAIDVFTYAVLGHVLVYDDVNPLVQAPAVAHDTIVAYAGSWAASPTPYGPIWLMLCALAARLAGPSVVGAVLVLKAIAAGAVVGTTALLAAAARRWGGGSATAAVLFGWNPLVQLELVGNGHNDAVMVLGLVAALWHLARHRSVGAAALASAVLVASGLVKYLSLAALPFVLLALTRARRPGSAVAAAALAAIATALLAFIPYWAGGAPFQRLLAVDSDYLASVSALVVLLAPGVSVWLLYPRLVLLGLVGLWQAGALLLRRASLAAALFEVFFVALLVATRFAGWYLPILLALAARSADGWQQARAVAFTVTASATTVLWAFVWPANQSWLTLTGFHLVIVPLTFLPPLLVAVVGWDRARLRQSVADSDRPPGSAARGPRSGRRRPRRSLAPP